MAPPRKQINIGFPIFAVGFTPKKPRIVIGGGGGATRAGVKNAMILYDLNPLTLDMTPVAEHQFGKKDDGCMSIAVHPKEKAFVAGVNSPEDQVAEGRNENCRVFHLKGDQFILRDTHKTLDSKDPFFHQKVARFSPDGKLLVTGTTDGKLSLWTWPDFRSAVPAIDHGGEISDADFDPFGKQLASVTADKCYVTDTSDGRTVWSIENPMMQKTIKSAFRACRFGIAASQGYLFLVINTKDRKKSYICKWQTSGWKLHRQKAISNKPTTSFAISDNGELLGYGSADLSVSVISAKGLQNVYRVPNAHGFPVTTLAFSPNSQLLVSGSADGTCHIAVVPQSSGSLYLIPLCLLALFMVVLLTYLVLLEDEQEL
ncbi:uncharacterized protein SPPG_05411 [Spizellomyces punctatus DAOM BR117]|uniref:Anaphase-promoting complex subunit 4 WD40 domain-containing protein n=1 Tax=Spizellomyces punctatus (strain DAOM BR117) TaxID=645134 RepID=A0A0L0HDV4_SPIPD|nr:uncharacterized protein SPPG_05411 [Spizellomyces punctatus DAOM BR117]KNC99154.1 hypothetical protein SPPG_05411 [Spizellomyces punctatus DAOM BR117]|eukprot:XP_016607194.1 hypothetical protein SPPG_05411 [Spizellomyces punctatus DAOM BR117]